MPDNASSRRLQLSIAVLIAILSPTKLARPATIPSLHGTTFTGTRVDLPDSLRSKTGILIIGFSQSSREAVTAWGRQLAADFNDSPAIAYYEMPVLASVPKLMRGFVASRIKADVSDRGKPHFLPITENEAAWRDIVHYAVPDTPYILLVDERGTILWQTQGPPTESTYAALKQQLQSPRPH